MNNERIAKLVDGYDKEIEMIRREMLRMGWSMRGGVTYEEAAYLSHAERKIIAEIVKDNMEATKKSGLPYF